MKRSCDWLARLAALGCCAGLSAAAADDTTSAEAPPDPYPATVAVSEPPPSPPPPQEPEGGRVLDEIVVTAQKTAQNVRDVPISITAVDGEQVRQNAITETQELVQYTPNIRFQSGTNNLPSVSIRGFGSPPLGRNLEPSVGLSIDDVFYGRSTFTNDAVFDVDRLEVLRGPQGTLFGKNTVAGVLNFTTGAPTFDPAGYVTLAGGSLEERRAEGAVGLPLVEDRVAARLAFRARERRIGVFDTTTGRDGTSSDVAGRAKLHWLLTDSLAADIGYLDSTSRSQGVGFVLEKATPRSLERFRKYDPRTVADSFAGLQALDIDQFSDRRTRSLSAKLQQEIGDLAFARGMSVALIVDQASAAAPYRFDTDFSPIPLTSLSSVGPELYRQRSLELRTTLSTPLPFTPEQSIDWVVGVFGIRTNAEVTQLSNFNRNALIDFLLAGAGPVGNAPTLPAPVVERLEALGLPTDISALPSAPALFAPGEDREFTTNILRTQSTSRAAFVQATAHLTDDLAAVLGLRAGRETQHGFQSSQCTPNGGPPCFGAPTFAKQMSFTHSGDHAESELSPKAALTYRLTPGISVFGSWARGYKSGGFSGPLLAPSNLEYRPERARSMELGVKSRVFDGSLMLNLSGYRVKFDDLQVQLFDGVNIVTINAARATSQGVEMDFQWLPPLEFLTIAGSFGMEDVSYDSFPCGPAIAGSSGGRPECNRNNSPNPPPTQDLTGRTTPYTPRFTGALTPMLRFPLWPSRDIGGLLGVDLLYQGTQYLDADLDPQKFQDATLKLNARFAVKPLQGPWSIIFNAKNLTGEKERVLVMNQNQLVGNYVAIPYAVGPLYSLDLRYSWGL